MAYEVIARKWRPQRFEDVVGQDHVTRTLKNAIETQRLAHAYLFVGPRGIGKTSIARLFARALNCDKGPTIHPCGTCDSCREIATGTNLDVLEIDGASNNGVDQVRDLRDTIRYAPTHGTFKITIIDEVHMLSSAAFNALLKTLEEPPAHAKFFFATTDPQKVLPTIISRCQRFDLRRIPVPLIVERLRLIAKDENVTVDEEALLAVARGAEGGMRDAQSSLDQLIAFRGNTIVEADVLSVFGLVARAQLEALAGAVLTGDIAGLIRLVGELDEAGKDLQRLTVEMMEHFRNLLVALHVDDPTVHTDLTDVQVVALRRQAQATDATRVLRVLQILAETEDRMKFALSRRTLLETALIRSARAATATTLEEVLAQLQALRAGLPDSPEGGVGAAGARPENPVAPVVAPPVAPAPVGTPAPASGPSSPPPEAVREPRPRAYRSERGPAAPAAAVDPVGDLATLRSEWIGLIEKFAKRAVMAKGLLKDARPVSVEADRVTIGFDSEFPEEMARFESGRDRKALEQTLGAVLKRPVAVHFVLVDGELDTTPAVPVAEADKAEASVAPAVSPAPPASAESAPVGPKPKGRSMQEWTKDDAVRRTLELFNGSIVDVRE